MKEVRSNKTPIVAAIALSAIFALLVVVAKELSNTLTLQQQVYGRSFIALLLAIAIYHSQFRLKELRKIPSKDIYLSIARGFVLYVGAVSLVSYSAIHSTVFLTSVLGVLPFSVLFGIVFFKEKFTLGRQLALLVAFLGVIAISNPIGAKFHLGRGEWAAIASSVLFAAAYVTRRLHTTKISNAQISGFMFISGSIGLLILSLLLGQGFLKISQLTGHTIVWLVIGGICNISNIMFVNYVFHRLPAITANILLTAEFIFAIIFGYAFYSQVPLLIELVGAVLITASIIILSVSENKKTVK